MKRFDELNDKAQRYALEYHREVNVEDGSWIEVSVSTFEDIGITVKEYNGDYVVMEPYTDLVSVAKYTLEEFNDKELAERATAFLRDIDKAKSLLDKEQVEVEFYADLKEIIKDWLDNEYAFYTSDDQVSYTLVNDNYYFKNNGEWIDF
jgi:hypothetical protein